MEIAILNSVTNSVTDATTNMINHIRKDVEDTVTEQTDNLAEAFAQATASIMANNYSHVIDSVKNIVDDTRETISDTIKKQLDKQSKPDKQQPLIDTDSLAASAYQISLQVSLGNTEQSADAQAQLSRSMMTFIAQNGIDEFRNEMMDDQSPLRINIMNGTGHERFRGLYSQYTHGVDPINETDGGAYLTTYREHVAIFNDELTTAAMYSTSADDLQAYCDGLAALIIREAENMNVYTERYIEICESLNEFENEIQNANSTMSFSENTGHEITTMMPEV